MTTPTITFSVLKAIAPDTSDAQLARFVADLDAGFKERKATTLGVANTLCQFSWESDHFRATKEYASGAAYEGRLDLGNTQKGDGERFPGRSLVMWTGRGGYATVGKRLGVDFIAHPELLENEYAVKAAFAYMDEKNLWEPANRGDFLQVTLKINGGRNGYLGRMKMCVAALKALGIGDGASP